MRITVVGDTLLDEDVIGRVRGMSPEAGAPVLDAERSLSRAGGAGLVATLLKRDGHEVELVTALSGDEGGRLLRRRLNGVRVTAVPSGAPTPVKRRLRDGSRTVCRIDEGCEPPPPPRVHAEAVEAIERAEAIIVSDYGRGLAADPAVRDALQHRGQRVPLVWDPHLRGADPVPSAALVTPNLTEAAAAAGTRPREAEAPQAAARLRERYGCQAVVVTLGEQGAVLQRGGRDAERFHAVPVPDADACGAGDRFASTAVAVLARGGDHHEAVAAGIASAGSFLTRGGVASLALGPVAAPPEEGASALEIARAVRTAGGTVVAAGGCFDLLHAGHVRVLEAARELGDCLIVCLNSDDSVHRLKGAHRPIIGQADRAEMLLALACVDAVMVFDEDGPEAVLRTLKPDIWVKGGDYTAEALPETELIARWGGRTATMPYHLGRSTTRMVEALAKVG